MKQTDSRKIFNVHRKSATKMKNKKSKTTIIPQIKWATTEYKNKKHNEKQKINK